AHDLESDRVERKRSTNNRARLRSVICAFANDYPGHDKPGYLLIGVEDDGRLARLKVTDAILRLLANLRDEGDILPLPAIKVARVEVGPGADAAVVEVPPHPTPPVRSDGRTWIRIGRTQRVASFAEERTLTERRAKNARAWDEWLCGGAQLDEPR